MSSQSPRPSSRDEANKPARSRNATAKQGVRTPGRSAGRPVQSSRMPIWVWAVGILVVALLIVGGVVLLRPTVGSADLSSVQQFSDLSRDHVIQNVTYPQTPPVGGPHNAIWQNCGIYDKPVQNEHAVHSLEHGAVWITYQPDLPADQVEKLRSLIQGHSYALLSPYPNLPSKIVISAWGLQLKVDSAADPRLPAFIAKYEQGSQTPEPGALCRGGVGDPIK